jgi:hypothetical protein
MMQGVIHCKKVCKCHNVPPPNTTIEKEKKHILFVFFFYIAVDFKVILKI